MKSRKRGTHSATVEYAQGILVIQLSLLESKEEEDEEELSKLLSLLKLFLTHFLSGLTRC